MLDKSTPCHGDTISARKMPAILTTLIVVMAIALTAVNIVLLRQNRALHAAMPPSAKPDMLQPGTQMPVISGSDLDNRKVELSFGGQHEDTLLVVFSPTCHFCQESWEYWDKVLATMNRNRVRPVLVDTSGTATKDFLRQKHAEDIAFLHLDERIIMQCKMGSVPQTILIGSDGTVKKLWAGRLSNDTTVDILRNVS